jgi:hypothetical protein
LAFEEKRREDPPRLKVNNDIAFAFYPASGGWKVRFGLESLLRKGGFLVLKVAVRQ